MTIDEPRLTQT